MLESTLLNGNHISEPIQEAATRRALLDSLAERITNLDERSIGIKTIQNTVRFRDLCLVRENEESIISVSEYTRLLLSTILTPSSNAPHLLNLTETIFTKFLRPLRSSSVLAVS